MANQHIVDITIIWPDAVWVDADESEYLKNCLTGVQEYFETHPIKNTEQKLTLMNKFGRTYAEIHINPCK
jgi:hypothetical protein